MEDHKTSLGDDPTSDWPAMRRVLSMRYAPSSHLPASDSRIGSPSSHQTFGYRSSMTPVHESQSYPSPVSQYDAGFYAPYTVEHTPSPVAYISHTMATACHPVAPTPYPVPVTPHTMEYISSPISKATPEHVMFATPRATDLLATSRATVMLATPRATDLLATPSTTDLIGTSVSQGVPCSGLDPAPAAECIHYIDADDIRDDDSVEDIPALSPVDSSELVPESSDLISSEPIVIDIPDHIPSEDTAIILAGTESTVIDIDCLSDDSTVSVISRDHLSDYCDLLEDPYALIFPDSMIGAVTLNLYLGLYVPISHVDWAQFTIPRPIIYAREGSDLCLPVRSLVCAPTCVRDAPPILLSPIPAGDSTRSVMIMDQDPSDIFVPDSSIMSIPVESFQGLNLVSAKVLDSCDSCLLLSSLVEDQPPPSWMDLVDHPTATRRPPEVLAETSLADVLLAKDVFLAPLTPPPLDLTFQSYPLL